MNFDIPVLVSEAVKNQVTARWDSLTKPRGSLGRLEELVVQLALIADDPMPSVERKGLYVFCADHGVAAEGVSPYPSSVTAQMVKNFLRGGAAINVLCRQAAITHMIVDAGVDAPVEAGVVDRKIARGTGNFAWEPAMRCDQAEEAIERGAALAKDAKARFDICGVGEMGIGNTTSAAALLSVFGGLTPDLSVGRGAGLDDSGLRRKADVISRALDLHRPNPADPVGVLQAVGGFEIAMIAGFLLGAAESRLPVVVDGFIASSAALVAHGLSANVIDYVLFSHRSAEQAHSRMLSFLKARPILDLDLRLGEGTGAALALQILDSAVRLYREMSTFAEAGVSDKG
ncbi:MAG: nicotinate-nucleotide--dimethylbenzimidazole phosphoribosyltransferase [Bryobacteraceae bacterium]